MPRKKKEPELVKYYMPNGTKEKIDAIVDNSTFYKNKPLWKQKFYHLVEYITFQNINNEIVIETEFVNIHQETMASILGIYNQQMATMLNDAVNNTLLTKDGIMIPAVTSTNGKNKEYIQDGKSYGYQFKDWNEIIEIEIVDSRNSFTKIHKNTWRKTGEYIPELKLYREVLSLIKIIPPENFIEEILRNKQKKKSQKENYRIFIEAYESNFRENNNKKCILLPFDGKFVPVIKQANSKTVSSYLDSFKDGKFVPCQKCSFKTSRYRKKKKAVKVINEEPDRTTISRCNRAISIINNNLVLPNRPDRSSRVYCEITHLYRELRKYIRLDGEKIIGIDIANSQPLLATILLRRYWLSKNIELPVDVAQYQKNCESGIFYEEFMQAINLPDELRAYFKQDFFQKVFFSKVIERKNILKDLFIKKYPSCWEAICDEKGGLYSKNYKEFSKKLQKVEAAIIFDHVNVGLIKKGINAFNIFDSIYVNNRNDFESAKQLIMEGFNAAGINPSLKIEYEQHLDENERKAPLEAQHQDKNPRTATNQDEDRLVVNDTISTPAATRYHDNDSDATINIKPREIKEEEMKKIYTVDELLSSKRSKENTPVKPVEAPTKLQHLKRQVNEEFTKEDVVVKSKEEVDDTPNEQTKEKSKEFTDKEIYDIVVAELKSNGEKITKENVEYLMKVFKEELEKRNKPKEIQPTYTYVNPYVKH